MEAKVYISADGRCSLEQMADAVQVRTAFIGKGFRLESGRLLAPDGTEHTLTFSGSQLCRVAPDGKSVDLHVSNIERFQ